ncbi:MAG: protein-export chaperone SecB [Clostridia bacterium]
MPTNSILKLNKYSVKNINYEINTDFYAEPGAQINIAPTFTRNITKIDNNNAIVSLSIKINKTKGNAPFSINIEVEGRFELDNWENPDLIQLMEDNTIAILFPYLRSLVTMVTSNTSSTQPYILPIINITALFKKNSSNKDINN